MEHRIEVIFCLCSLAFFCSEAVLNREVYEYSDCKGTYQHTVGVQDGRIPDSAMIASSFQSKRQPKDGRVGRSAGAWSPSIQNAFQWLQVDIGSLYVVTAIYLQGRQGSDEYVREFFLEYSDDSQTWRRYTNQLGIPEIFEGNYDDSGLQKRVLQYPIVAQYIRFNPQRWNMVIALRVEIEGCPFKPETASFDGESFIEFDMSRQAVQTTEDLLELRFRTSKPDGVILYASGNQGDLLMLEMRRGYLYFKIDLGSTVKVGGFTEVRAGSLLDDNQWHDVIITRDRKKLKVVVDRLINKLETNGLFFRLDLDKFLFIGGVPYFNQDGISVKYNFDGCIQNINLNGAKLIPDALERRIPTVSIKNNVGPYCGVEAKIPITFPTLESHLFITTVSGQVVHVSLEFRTHDNDGLLVYHPVKNGYVAVQVDENGFISYTIQQSNGQVIQDVVRNTDMMSPTSTFTDGLWHSFYMYVDRNKINCTVDRNAKVSQRSVDLSPETNYYIGGNVLYNGFRGCIRNLQVAQREVDLDNLVADKEERIIGAQLGTCAIRDRCTPNPCEHGGVCEQSWNTFACDCTDTGYKGELCHTPENYISCDMFKQYSNEEGKEETMIDIDGSGPFKPFKAACERDDNGEIITYVGHDSMGYVRVNGFQLPGSYVRKITYSADDVLVLEEIIDRARTCRQNVEYRCMNAKLLADPGLNDKNIKTWGWWVGRTYQPMYYWGGAAPGSGKCKCGLEEDGCGSQSSTCHCDKTISNPSQAKEEVDQGYLVHKEYLPVLELHLGDTGTTTTDNKWAEHKIGELECFGDNLFDSTVTFTQPDGALEFATFQAENAGDIWFQFKTTQSDGVMIHCTGSQVADFVEIRLFQSDTIQFRYDVGNGVAVLAFKSPSPLNDDRWHTVHTEKNRKQAWIKVDDYPDKSLSEDADLVRELDLSSPLYVGSLVDYQDGYVGCMRGLRVNGVLMDMSAKLANGEVYGVRAGCVGKCASSPCFNQGTCREGYSHYTCDCSYTPWRGWNCGREVGVNLKNNYMIRYTFDETQGLSASDFQFAMIGFSTKVKQGILMQMRDETNSEYITVEINNNGGVKVAMDIGFERVEVNTPMEKSIDYANSQVHVVRIERKHYGRYIKVQVDDYPPGEEWFSSTTSGSDTILDDPKYLFIGNNDTSNTLTGFEGCIYRMQVDNIFPLKRTFQDPRPDYISLTPEEKVQEDMCGFEEVTVSPEPVRRRPYSGVPLNVTYKRDPQATLSDEEKVLVGVGCAIIVILIACVVLFCCRKRFEGADYETEEAVGAEYADNPDSAVVYNQTGLPNMAKSYEYFM
ncbi:neurexin-4 [Aplysia californica]|uniref:Neurexin-4 n=1 Tax=Aplysia californica TaxID=6500 RepID=A0ABM0JHX3_APLCA|nr:neurexin-4 [Aplysia californica]